MKFLKNNIWTILSLAFVFVLAMGDASAADSVAVVAQKKALNVFRTVKTIMFIVGGFGLVGLAFAAVFGKLNWKWFAALAVGLAILAAAGSIIEYATGDANFQSQPGGFGDSFQQSNTGSVGGAY